MKPRLTKEIHDHEGLKLNKYSASPSWRFKLKNKIDGKTLASTKVVTRPTLPSFNLRQSPVR
jgi:hypothetical protein